MLRLVALLLAAPPMTGCWSVNTHGEHRSVAHFDDVNSLPTFSLGVLQGVTSASTALPSEVVWKPEGLSGARYEVTVR